MTQQFMELDDGRVLIIGMVPGEGLLTMINGMRGDLEAAIVLDKDVCDELRNAVGGWVRVASQPEETVPGPQPLLRSPIAGDPQG